jgi:glycosyltransferase involved in cell wall biosynthesis
LKSDLAAHLSMLHEVRRRSDEFDIIHFHIDLLQLPLFADIATKTLTTLHGRFDLKDLRETYRCWPQFPLVSISNSQRNPMRFANWAGTVYHGLPAGQYQLSSTASGGYLAFLGRISPEKRPDRAIAIARAAGIPLRIAAKVDAADAAYFRDEIAPLLDDPLVEFIGEIGDADKSRFLGDAIALLFPIDWPEPFGLVMIEAMACGTPVVAWNCGSVSEVIDDGVTGRVVESLEEAVTGVAEVAGYDRAQIRGVFERRFSARRMALAYQALYERAQDHHTTRSRRRA